MKIIGHIDFTPVENCKNPDTYGYICVKCNDCGRFDSNGTLKSESKIKEEECT